MRMLSYLSTRPVSPKIMHWLSLPRTYYPSTRTSVWSHKRGLKNLDTWKLLWISMDIHSSGKTEKGEEEEVYVPILKLRFLLIPRFTLLEFRKTIRILLVCCNSNSSDSKFFLLHCISPTKTSLQI